MIVKEAEQILSDLHDLDVTTTEQKEQIRQALTSIAQIVDNQIFGVCAANQAEGIHALSSYIPHFGYELPSAMVQDLPKIDGAVYLKFNPRHQRCSIDVYTGDYRGVLISFQSDIADGYSKTHGHFPLNLFDR